MSTSDGFAALAVALLAATALSCAGAARGAVNPLEFPAPKHGRLQQALMLDVAVAGGRLVAVGERGLIVYSDDGGKRWTQADVPVYATLTAVAFPTPGLGWAVGHSGVILHSDDGGRSWTSQLDGSRVNEMEKVRAEAALREARAAGAAQARIARLERELRRAQTALEEGPKRPFLDVHFLDESTGVAVGAFGLAMRTSDGGRTWQVLGQAIDNPHGWHLNALGVAGEHLFIAGERGRLYRSDDRGRTWVRLPSPYEGTYFGVAADDRGVLAFGLEGRVYRSRDNGESWQRLPVPMEAAVTGTAHLPAGSLALISASGAVVCRAPDAGEFQVVRPKGRPLVAVVPAGDRGVLLASGIGGMTRLDIGDGC